MIEVIDSIKARHTPIDGLRFARTHQARPAERSTFQEPHTQVLSGSLVMVERRAGSRSVRGTWEPRTNDHGDAGCPIS